MKALALSLRRLCLICVVALSACPGKMHDANAPDAATPSWSTPTAPCDPLTAQERSTKLETIIAVGKDMNGTLYVVDRTASSERVFVSGGNTLYRKRVDGSGSTGDSDFSWRFDHDGTYERIVVRKQGSQLIGIALAPPDERTFFDELGDTAQPLTPVDPASIAHFAVRNLPGEVVVEFVAEAKDGSRIVVTRPKDDWTYEDFRVFYGMTAHLFERVTHFAGARSYRAFDFVVEGAAWHVIFASSLAPAIESALDTGKETLPLSLIDPPVPTPDDTFECFVKP